MRWFRRKSRREMKENFKKWNEVKEGDTIYYFDHGRLREQTVHSALWNKRKFHDGRMSEDIYLRIKAGKGSEFTIYKFWVDDSDYKDFYFRRFTCKEAAIEWIKKRKDHAMNKAVYYGERFQKYDKLTKKYIKFIQENEQIV